MKKILIKISELNDSYPKTFSRLNPKFIEEYLSKELQVSDDIKKINKSQCFETKINNNLNNESLALAGIKDLYLNIANNDYERILLEIQKQNLERNLEELKKNILKNGNLVFDYSNPKKQFFLMILFKFLTKVSMFKMKVK